jgi:hypothetical protein
MGHDATFCHDFAGTSVYETVRLVSAGGTIFLYPNASTWKPEALARFGRTVDSPLGDVANNEVQEENQQALISSICWSMADEQNSFVCYVLPKGSRFLWHPDVSRALSQTKEAVRVFATSLCMYGASSPSEIMLVGTIPTLAAAAQGCVHVRHREQHEAHMNDLPPRFAVKMADLAQMARELQMGYLTTIDGLMPDYGAAVELDVKEEFPLVPTPEIFAATSQLTQRKVGRTMNNQILEWTAEAELAFDATKRMVARCIALACPDWAGAISGENPFLIYADKSDLAIGSGLLQRPKDSQTLAPHLKNQVRPLGMMSKSLDATQRNWTVWEGELYACRESLYHFRAIVGACHVVLATDL